MKPASRKRKPEVIECNEHDCWHDGLGGIAHDERCPNHSHNKKKAMKKPKEGPR